MAVTDNAAGITIDAAGQHNNSKLLDGLPAAAGTGQAMRYDEAVRTDGSNALTGVQVGVSPTAANHLTTRQFTDRRLISAYASTTVALPAYTYANGGSGGVGATITGNANGAFPTIDGVTLVANDPEQGVFLFQNGASASDNGVYMLTTQGSAGAAFVATRYTSCDTAAKIAGSKVRVQLGVMKGGKEYTFVSVQAITVGTTSLFWLNLGTTNPSEVYSFFDDFDWVAGTAAVRQGPFPGVAAVSGTGAAVTTSAINSATIIGAIAGALGSTTTGRTAVTGSPNGTFNEVSTVTIGANNALYLDIRVRVSALSNGTDTYNLWFGFGDSIAVFPPNNFVGGMYQQSGTGADTHYQAMLCNGGSSTKTVSGNTVTAGTFVHLVAKKDAGDTNIHVLFDGVEVGSGLSTNFPANPVAPMIAALKSAGTTGQSWVADWFGAVFTTPTERAA